MLKQLRGNAQGPSGCKEEPAPLARRAGRAAERAQLEERHGSNALAQLPGGSRTYMPMGQTLEEGSLTSAAAAGAHSQGLEDRGRSLSASSGRVRARAVHILVSAVSLEPASCSKRCSFGPGEAGRSLPAGLRRAGAVWPVTGSRAT